MNSRQFLILCIALVISGVASGAAVGGWQTIPDLKAKRVQEAAKYSVETYNERSKSALVYERVIKGEGQVVAGIKYRLVIKAKDGAASNMYEAVVLEKPWSGFMNLTSFKQV